MSSWKDPEAGRQEGGLAHALLERREVELEGLEDVGVGEEGDGGARLGRRFALLEVVQGPTALERLRPMKTVATDFDIEALR